MNKLNIGDIYEITTPKGKAYLHYIFKDNTISELVRVLDGIFVNPPDNFEELIKKKEKFMIFFPLKYALKLGIVVKVGFALSESYSRPQFMRTEKRIQNEFLGWEIIDTESWKRFFVKELSESQKLLSPWGIWNDTLLIERLLSDWSLENWC